MVKKTRERKKEGKKRIVHGPKLHTIWFDRDSLKHFIAALSNILHGLPNWEEPINLMPHQKAKKNLEKITSAG